ncbi:thiaminase II [Aerococcus suis]|uniref:Aminopyrimidine aminohydrolase n=1 Tax=Aerococcus suis TaxID=371602 RepID=A0A1W1Z7X4_9LACT|nr:thiaminase II [Aerococcus suis]MCI7240012.1 thiaminase II [Aerococcus suis]MDD7758601.1 thiaminase II [Aerococcus suis]MDY4646721.1 thiaminase II [Aerococcus suis]SMC44018.1 thiaminase /4-amino-5-aminomethyl-2-methylpyrimidine deaminase [Aerococcus suis]
MTFSERIWPKVEPLWATYLDHPFVKGLGDDSLDPKKFQHWLIQDYNYLIEYARLFAIGAAKAPNLKIMQTFTDLLYGVLFDEMDGHREYAKEYGLSLENIENTENAEVTTAYTSYMLNVSQAGNVENVMAAILTCVWSYYYIGHELAKKEDATSQPHYGSWIETYSNDDYKELVDQSITLMDELAAGKPERELEQLEDIVITTSRYEYLFWDMAWNQENWRTPDSFSHSSTSY